MARARSPDSIEAEKLYKGGMKLVDIAKKIGKPEGTVRRWKSTQDWDGTAGKTSKKKTKASVRKRKIRAFGKREAGSREIRMLSAMPRPCRMETQMP